MLFGHCVLDLNVLDNFVCVNEFGVRDTLFAQSANDNSADNENTDYYCKQRPHRKCERTDDDIAHKNGLYHFKKVA